MGSTKHILEICQAKLQIWGTTIAPLNSNETTFTTPSQLSDPFEQPLVEHPQHPLPSQVSPRQFEQLHEMYISNEHY